MAKSKSDQNTNNLVLAMSTLIIVMAGIIVGVSKSKQEVQVVTQAAPEKQLLTGSDEVDDLESELQYLSIDPVSEELRILDNLN